MQVIESYSPRIETDAGAFYLDLGRGHDEEILAHTLQKKIQDQRLSAGIGLASNKLVARLAARHGGLAPVCVKAGDEARFLAPFAVRELDPPDELAETLTRWGIRTLGELAALPSKKMIAALGKEGWELQQAALGVDHRPFIPFQRTPVYLEKTDFEWVLNDLESLVVLARPLLDRLTTHLRRGGLACRRLEITLRLEPDGEARRSVRLRSPTDDPKILVRLLQGQLIAHPPGAPLTGLTLVAHPDMPRPAQLSLFGPPAASPAKLATTLAQLAALLGSDRVGSPELVDGHRPERYALDDYAPPPAPLLPDTAARKDHAALTAIRVLRPPIPLLVVTSDVWPWEPLRLHGAKPGGFSAQGHVRAAAGPWKVEDVWWDERGVSRDYWDVEMKDGIVCRIFQDLKTKQWGMDGVYD